MSLHYGECLNGEYSGILQGCVEQLPMTLNIMTFIKTNLCLIYFYPFQPNYSPDHGILFTKYKKRVAVQNKSNLLPKIIL